MQIVNQAQFSREDADNCKEFQQHQTVFSVVLFPECKRTTEFYLHYNSNKKIQAVPRISKKGKFIPNKSSRYYFYQYFSSIYGIENISEEESVY